MKKKPIDLLSVIIITVLIISKFMFTEETYQYIICISCLVLFIAALCSFIRFKVKENKIDIPSILSIIITLFMFVFFLTA